MISDPGEQGTAVRLSSVLSGLSAALDITEGHPPGHALRSCLISMHLARALQLSDTDASDLFYAALLKDAGCSSNAGRVFELFGGPEHETKRALWLRDWRRLSQKMRYAWEAAEPDGRLPARLRRLWRLASAGSSASRELFEIRCARSAEIARALGCSQATAAAVLTMDEHWDGGGNPYGLRGHDIPLAGRIIGLAQVVEIFWSLGGPARALEVARARKGRWFDPELVHCLCRTADAALWTSLEADDPAGAVAAVEPPTAAVLATRARLDDIAAAFAWVIDAKSSFTFRHSERVAALAIQIAAALGMTAAAQVRLRRAALLHDIGKLAVPNSILDKPGPLTPDEWIRVREHPIHTLHILRRVPVFSEFAADASQHHERLDGRGYPFAVAGSALSSAARILCVADVIDALLSDRPYRRGLPLDEVRRMLAAERGTAFCPDVVDAALATIEDRPPSPHTSDAIV